MDASRVHAYNSTQITIFEHFNQSISMKLTKYLVCGLLVTGSLSALTSCEDEKSYGEPPRLFSPVVTVTTSSNDLECKWQGINGATKYELTLLKETSLVGEDGKNVYNTVETVEATASPYTFENLDWDDRYRVDIKAIGDGIESYVYSGEAVTISYPTKLKSVANVIDTGVKIEWNEDNKVPEWTDVAYINVFTRNEDGSVTPYLRGGADAEALSRADEGEDEIVKDPIVAPEENPDYYYTLTENDIRRSACEVYGLLPATDYRVVAYNKDGEYRGRRDFKTRESEVYENPDLVYDLRVEAVDTLKNDFIETLPEGAVVVLQGGKKYICSGTLKFTKSVKFTTGMSLSGKAIMASGGYATEGDLNRLEFNNVVLTCMPEDDLTSNFGGRYIFNHSNVTTINDLVFESVDIKYMRGGIRSRKDGQEWRNITFNNCTLDSIGGYRLVHLDNANTKIGTLKITNSTLSNVDGIVRANNRDNTSVDNITVEDCTFAFCSNNAEYFAMKRDGCNPNLSISVSNCIIAGNHPKNTALGISVNEGTVVATNNVYVASDYKWTMTETGEIKTPFGNTEDMTQKMSDIWVNPAALDFTLKSAQLPCSQAGDPRWRVE